MLRYVLPVLWRTSHLGIMGVTLKGGGLHAATVINDMAIPEQSLMSMNTC